jgi:PST family polysaccharide transporter
LVSVLVVWIILPWKPRLTLNRQVGGSLMKFGASVTAIDLIAQITDNLDYLIIGRAFGLVPLSIYTLAYRLPEMLLISNLWVMAGVVFPAFSSIQDQPDELRRAFLASVRVVNLITVPISLGLLIAAEPIVRVVFGEQWLEIIPILRLLAVYAWVYSLGYHVGGLYKAIGRPDISLKLSILTLLIIVPALLIGARFGLIGIALGHVVAVLLRRVISLSVAKRFVKVSTSDLFQQLKPSFMAAAVMIPSTLAALYFTETVHPFLHLSFVILSGGVSYLGMLWWLEKESLIELMRILKIHKAAA